MRMSVGSFTVGDGAPCYLIAEAGSNHDGSIDQARRLVEVAADSGANAVKFQTFRADRLYPPTAGHVDYLSELGVRKPLYELMRDMEMPPQWVAPLSEHAARRGIAFLSTPFDEGSVDLIEPYVPAYKIASYELTHIPLIRHVARKGKPMFLSTGGASLDEVTEAVAAARAEGNDQICVMQCTAKYPAPLDQIDVRALDVIRDALGVLVGLSDHSTHPYYAPVAAVACGASVIEKHFTLDRRLPGPDHSYALEPGELRLMVESVRGVEMALGRAEKLQRPAEAELSNYRRSIFTTKPINAGERLTDRNTAILRRTGQPDPGLPPRDYETVIGRTAALDLEAWHALGPSDIE